MNGNRDRGDDDRLQKYQDGLKVDELTDALGDAERIDHRLAERAGGHDFHRKEAEREHRAQQRGEGQPRKTENREEIGEKKSRPHWRMRGIPEACS